MGKRWLTIVLALCGITLLIAGCDQPLISSEPISSDSGSGALHSQEATPHIITTDDGEVKSFTIHATRYAFDLNEIRVKQGDTVELNLENVKGYHTIKVEGYNLEVKRNRPVTFIATEKGQFTFRCGIVCGSGHDEMTGKLIVE